MAESGILLSFQRVQGKLLNSAGVLTKPDKGPAVNSYSSLGSTALDGPSIEISKLETERYISFNYHSTNFFLPHSMGSSNSKARKESKNQAKAASTSTTTPSTTTPATNNMSASAAQAPKPEQVPNTGADASRTAKESSKTANYFELIEVSLPPSRISLYASLHEDDKLITEPTNILCSIRQVYSIQRADYRASW
jgi:hypothetical protein